MNDKSYTRIFRLTQTKSIKNFAKIKIVYKLYCLFAKKKEIAYIDNDKRFWKNFTNWIATSGCEKMSDFFVNNVKDVMYTSEELMRIKTFIFDKLEDINPNTISPLCPTTSLLCFLIKDLLEYGGIIVNKYTPYQRLIENYNYLKEIRPTIESKVLKYINLLK